MLIYLLLLLPVNQICRRGSSDSSSMDPIVFIIDISARRSSSSMDPITFVRRY